VPELGSGRERFQQAFASASRTTPRAPHFDLRVDAESARLRLARPLTTGFGRVESCVLDLGRLPSPVDLRLGALGFRARRRRLVSARIWLSSTALERWAEERSVGLHVDRVDAELMHFTLVDEQGALGFALRAVGVGGDLSLGLDGLRARSGAEAPSARLHRAALRLGLNDGYRLERPLFWLLADAFAESGQRAPEADALPVVQLAVGDGGFWLSAGDEAAELLDEPRLGELWPGAVERTDLDDMPDWFRLEHTFQTALDRGHAHDAAQAARVMLGSDPSPRLAVEAAHLAAVLCAPPVAAQLLARAATRMGDDVVALAKAAEAAPAAGRAARLEVVEAIERSPCEDTLRGELMAMALRRGTPTFVDLGVIEASADDAEAADSVIAAAIERALELAPHSPEVRLLAGEAHLARGEAAHALDHFRRAARAFAAAGRPTDSANASLYVARVLDELGRGGAAERILVDARAETDEAPVVLRALAQRWADAGLLADAYRAYASLLRQPSGRPGLEDALAEAARFALAHGNGAAATPLVARLLRERPEGEVGVALRDELRRLEANVSHVNGPWDPDANGSA